MPAKPSLMKAIQNADVFVSTGLELDGGWLPLVLPGSRNPKIQPGTKGFVDASQGVDVLEKPVGTVSRAEGDIHPLGNPHYYVDPKDLEVVADHLAEVFSQLDPANAADYAANAKAFDERMDASLDEVGEGDGAVQGRLHRALSQELRSTSPIASGSSCSAPSSPSPASHPARATSPSWRRR